MTKPIAITILFLSITAIVLARFPQWSGQHPQVFTNRSDAHISEYMAGKPIEEMPLSMREGIEKRDGKPGALQSHRYVTPFLLSRIPGNWRDRWSILAVISVIVMCIGAWYVGLAMRGDWRAGALTATLWLATVGWQIGRIPWHKDTVVSAIEAVVIALFVWKRWTWLSVALVIGVLCKESFVFLAGAIWAGMVVEQLITWRRSKWNSPKK